MESISHIILGCREKKQQYQKLLYEHYFGFALKTVFRYIYRYEKAMDVVNDGFVKAFQHFDQFYEKPGTETEHLFMAWLKKIMINTAIDELRKTKMTPEIGGIPDWVWQEADYRQNADAVLHYKEVISLLKALPPLYRTIFNMYVIDGYNHIEIAAFLNISEGTSKSGLSRARALLQKSINKTEEKEKQQYAVFR